jgi:hypothetical protein
MYRTMLSFNAQTYGWAILKLVDAELDVPLGDCYQAAVARFAQLQGGKPAIVH